MPKKKDHAPVAKDRMLREKKVLEEKVPFSKSLFRKLVREGRLPKPRKLTSKCAVWLESELDAAIAIMLEEGKAM